MNTLRKLNLVVAVAAAVGLLGMNTAMAHKGGKANAGYVGDSNGHLVVDSANKCVKNGAWTPQLALEECGDKVAVAEKKPEPPAPKPAPAPAVEKVEIFPPAAVLDGAGATQPVNG